MYVLPYGQMSLWGATVITNLMSAIPWIGQDIVESTSMQLVNLMLVESILPTVGSINVNALKKGNVLRLDKKEYTLIPPSFIALIVGIIDGDGYIQITKTGKGFITMKLVISVHLEDLSSLQYIYSVLKIGKITIYKDNRSPTCKLIFNKTDLQEILFPLLIYHNIFFLTATRRTQFDLAMFILKNDIKVFEKISNKQDIPTIFKLPETPSDYVKLSFFKNWIVGFTVSEGSFFVKSNNDGCFQLKQRLHENLFEAFKIIFNTNRKINNQKGLYSQFSVSSKSDIQAVIDFFSHTGLHPLIGLKNIQYFKWLTTLSNSIRYKNINFPNTPT